MSSNPTYDFVAAPHIGRIFTRHILVRWDSGAWKEEEKLSQDVLHDFACCCREEVLTVINQYHLPIYIALCNRVFVTAVRVLRQTAAILREGAFPGPRRSGGDVQGGREEENDRGC
jgi:hypothetical protein